MAYRIRAFREDDADALAAIATRAIRVIGPRGYSSDQVGVWAGRHGDPAKYIERDQSGDILLVAADHADAARAYAILERDGHLDHLYCDPDHTRRGLAERLLAEAESAARSMNVARLYTEASELARPAFERAGYRVTHRRDFELDRITIHNFAMEKVLA